MTWRVNFVRSKDAQKQLARTSLSTVNRYRDISESATFSFQLGSRPQAADEFGSESGYFFNLLSRVERKKSAMNLILVDRESAYFRSDD